MAAMAEPVGDDAAPTDVPATDASDAVGGAEEPTEDTSEAGAGEGTEGQSSIPGGYASLLDSLLHALQSARPEVAEHVVRAAHELVLAGQALVDAAQQTIRDRQDPRAQEPRAE